MAPHRREIENDEALLGLRAGEQLGTPILPHQALVVRRSHGRGAGQQRQHKSQTQQHRRLRRNPRHGSGTEGATGKFHEALKISCAFVSDQVKTSLSRKAKAMTATAVLISAKRPASAFSAT